MSWPQPPTNCPSLTSNRSVVSWTTADFSETYPSLLDLYTEWYRAYWKADFPRLFVRYEDTLVHPEAVTRMVADCVGVTKLREPFFYQTAPAKLHGKPTNLLMAILKLVLDDKFVGMTEDDIEFARAAVRDSDLLARIGYHV